MKKLMHLIIVVVVCFYSTHAFSGKLVYRDGAHNIGCNVTESFPTVRAPRGFVADKSRIVRTLTCNNKTISVVTMPAPVCSPKGGGCFMPPLVECVRAICRSLVERVNDTDNFDFNYNLPGVDILFGTISAKSSANVFSDRALSTNYIAYSHDGVLDKPVIVVEGYDPADNTYPDYYYHSGFNQMVYGGRDVFIVNFSNGSDALDNNAAFLERVINEINGSKIGNYPAVVIGYSMGGIVARKALKAMELKGDNHKTSLYVSYDAPHLGANVPVELEQTVEALISKLDSATAGYTSSSLRRARHVYNSPAAREMLISGPSFKAAKPVDFPEKLVRVAVTSGSLTGLSGMQSNSVYEGEYIASFKFYLYDSWIGTLSKSFDWYSGRRGGFYYNNVPGSFEQQFRNAYLELKNGAASFSVYQEAKARNITFVPTVSSLAVSVDPSTYLKNIFINRSPFDKYIAVDQDSNIDPCISFDSQLASGKNLIHGPGYENFNYNQLMQLRCALDRYQVINPSIPDRSFKQY